MNVREHILILRTDKMFSEEDKISVTTFSKIRTLNIRCFLFQKEVEGINQIITRKQKKSQTE